jgi:hypothetical protein
MRNSVSEAQGSSASPTAKILAKVDEQFQLLTDQLTAVANGDTVAENALLSNPQVPQPLKDAINAHMLNPTTLPAILASLDKSHTDARTSAAALGQRIEQGIKRAFTNSITQIYQNAIWLVLLSFAIILVLLDEIPLRKSNRDVPIAAE